MFLSVLTKNLNWESLTKNLVTFNFIMGVHWKIWIFQGGVHKLKVVGGGWGWTVVRMKWEGGMVKKGVFSLPHFGRQGACHDITKSADSQTNKNFSDNDCMTAEFCRKVYQRNDFRLTILGNNKVLEKNQIGWRQMLLLIHPSGNNFLVVVAKIYTEADFKVS